MSQLCEVDLNLMKLSDSFLHLMLYKLDKKVFLLMYISADYIKKVKGKILGLVKYPLLKIKAITAYVHSIH